MILPGVLGYLAVGLVLLTFGMRSMVPMRMVAIGSNFAFIAYGLSLGLTPVWVLHGLLLPMNIYRLRECQRRARRRQRAAPVEPSLAWLQPVIATRRFARGDILFHKGDFAHDLYYVLQGRVRLRDIDGRIGPGDPLAALSLAGPGRTRIATAVCETDCELLVVSATPRDRRPEPLRPTPGERSLAGLASWFHVGEWAHRRTG